MIWDQFQFEYETRNLFQLVLDYSYRPERYWLFADLRQLYILLVVRPILHRAQKMDDFGVMPDILFQQLLQEPWQIPLLLSRPYLNLEIALYLLFLNKVSCRLLFQDPQDHIYY